MEVSGTVITVFLYHAPQDHTGMEPFAIHNKIIVLQEAIGMDKDAFHQLQLALMELDGTENHV
jgi:hypothetical protein